MKEDDNELQDNNQECMELFDVSKDFIDDRRAQKRSLVWKFFEKVAKNRVCCHICKHEQNYQGTTGNLLRHLKARHQLDATIKGLQDSENQKRFRNLCTDAGVPTVGIKIENNPSNSFNINNDSSDDEMAENSYEQMNQHPVEFFNDETPIFGNNIPTTTKNSSPKVRKCVEEARVVAETMYYREKAGYYRLQKHLTALQAKKIKMEIEQMSANNANK